MSVTPRPHALLAGRQDTGYNRMMATDSARDIDNAAHRHRHGRAWRDLDGNEVLGLGTADRWWLLWTILAVLAFWGAVFWIASWVWA